MGSFAGKISNLLGGEIATDETIGGVALIDHVGQHLGSLDGFGIRPFEGGVSAVVESELLVIAHQAEQDHIVPVTDVTVEAATANAGYLVLFQGVAVSH